MVRTLQTRKFVKRKTFYAIYSKDAAEHSETSQKMLYIVNKYLNLCKSDLIESGVLVNHTRTWTVCLGTLGMLHKINTLLTWTLWSL